jgi:hypothetical protein
MTLLKMMMMVKMMVVIHNDDSDYDLDDVGKDGVFC